jgi:hypothetical protein
MHELALKIVESRNRGPWSWVRTSLEVALVLTFPAVQKTGSVHQYLAPVTNYLAIDIDSDLICQCG